MITHLSSRCDAYSNKLRVMADGEYAVAKKNADAIRAELAMSPSRSLQSVLDEKSTKCASFPFACNCMSLTATFNLAICKNAVWRH
jgi:hypothetical protein